MRSLLRKFSILLACAMVLAGCRKDDDVNLCVPSEPTDGRDRFLGTYLVYDTTGTYLYEMSISKFSNGGRDSLSILNYADTFDLKVLHESYWDQDFLQIGAFFPAFDQAGNRWSLWGGSGDDGWNTLVGDSLPLKFNLSNLAFYFEDGVPYFDCACKQIAVKQ